MAVVSEIQVGDVVAVAPPDESAYLAQVLFVEASNYAQVIRENDLAVICVRPEWVVQRLPGVGQRVTC